MDAIYLDHNATTPVDPQVLEAMLPYLRKEFGNPSSGYALGRRAHAACELARAEVANLIGAQPDEVARADPELLHLDRTRLRAHGGGQRIRLWGPLGLVHPSAVQGAPRFFVRLVGARGAVELRRAVLVG